MQHASGEPKTKKAAKPDAKKAAKPAASKSSVGEYLRARAAFEKELDAYWDDIAAKRRARMQKRRDKQTAVLEDYVLAQPPVYAGPPRPPGATPPRKEPRDVRLPPIPRLADFVKAAARAFQVHAAAAGQRSRIQARLRQGGARRGRDGESRRFASTPSRPAATAPTTCRPG